MSSLPKAVTWKRTGKNSDPRHFGSRANALQLRHTGGYEVDHINETIETVIRRAVPRHQQQNTTAAGGVTLQ